MSYDFLDTPYEGRLKQLCLVPLVARRTKSDLIVLFKILCEEVPLFVDQKGKQNFFYLNDRVSRITRSSDFNLLWKPPAKLLSFAERLFLLLF